MAGRYRLHELLGAGGMGKVWRATDEVLGRDVAVKRIDLSSAAPADVDTARERALREARIAAALHHPNVVAVFDVLDVEGGPWLVVEFVPSRNLRQVVDEHGEPPIALVASIGAQVAAALAAAHAAGIVHRDVKPENVLVADRTATVKLADFGIAHATSAPVVTATGQLSGTPAYFAPETARGHGTDARTDAYALGAPLYAAIEESPPHGSADGNVLALIGRIAQGAPPPPRRAGPLTGMLVELMADDPAARPAAARAHTELQRLAAELSAPPPAAVRRPRRTRLVAVLAALVLLAAGVTALVATGAPAPVVAAPPPERVAVDDPRADPCSVVDPAALEQFGPAVIVPDLGMFSECVVHVRKGDDPSAIGVYVELVTEPQLDAGERRARRPGGAAAVNGNETDNLCHRTVVLPDRGGFWVTANTWPGQRACDSADAVTGAALRLVAGPAVGVRPSPVDTTALGGIDACDLLSATEIARVTVVGEPAAGLGRWSCDWGAVQLDFFRYHPVAAQDLDAKPADLGGRAGMVRSVGADDYCRAYIPQRSFTAADGTARTEYVRVTVYSASTGDKCGAAVQLANAVVPRLPPPS